LVAKIWFEKVMVLYRTTAQPCRIGYSFVAFAHLQLWLNTPNSTAFH